MNGIPKPVPGDTVDVRYADRKACLKAIAERDLAADGAFWYSVVTTGVFCRPTCHSKPALARHIRIHPTIANAKAIGARACLRCNPEGLSIGEQNKLIIAAACRRIETTEEELSLADLAAGAGFSVSHFHRLFKAITGVTPRDYSFAQRAIKVRRGLARGRTITSVFYEAGFSSSGRFYEKSGSMLGMTPTSYRAGGPNETIRFALGECSLGSILVASSERGVSAILLGDDPEALLIDLQDRFPNANLVGADRTYEQLVARVIALVEQPGRGHDLPLDVRGTAFQQRVWRALLDVPAGDTISYAELARRVGAPRSIQDVACACASNNLAIAIPCHRVVKNNGGFRGYAWGLERKTSLLEREKEGKMSEANTPR